MQDGALETIETCIPAHLVVMVATSHSVLAQHPGALGEFLAIGRDHARVACGAQVFRGIEAERCGVAQSAGLPSAPFSAPGLGSVFDQFEPTLNLQASERIPIGALAVKVHGQDGFH